MAQQNVTYNDKTNPVPVSTREEQAVADDFNELKQIINANADDAESRLINKLDKPDSYGEDNIVSFGLDEKLADTGKSFENTLTNDPAKIPNSEIVYGISNKLNNSTIKSYNVIDLSTLKTLVSASTPGLYLILNDITLDENISIPSDVILHFRNTNINLNGYVITGTFEVDVINRIMVFDVSNGGYISGKITNSDIYVHWFGEVNVAQTIEELDLSNSNLIFEPITYDFEDRNITIREDNVHLIGNGAIFTYNATTTPDVRVKFRKPDAEALYVVSISVTEGDNSIAVTPTIYDNVEVGDFVRCRETSASLYDRGLFAEVLKKESSTLYLSHAFRESIVVDELVTYKSMLNCSVENITVYMPDAYTNGIQIDYGRNCQIKSCVVYGDGGPLGIGILGGINGTVTKCYVRNIFDRELVINLLGYGISVSGHNMEVSFNQIEECRHCVGSGTRVGYNENIWYHHNECLQLFTEDVGGSYYASALDFHGSTEGVMENNYIKVNPPSLILRGYGISARAQNTTIRNNYITSVSGISTVLIYVFENWQKNVTIENNRIMGTGYIYFRLRDVEDISPININIINNSMEDGYINIVDARTIKVAVRNLNIRGNNIKSVIYNNSIYCNCILDNSIIEGNNMLFETPSTGSDRVIVRAEDADNENILIQGNIFKATLTPLNQGVRYANEKTKIIGNIFDCGSTSLFRDLSNAYNYITGNIDLGRDIPAQVGAIQTISSISNTLPNQKWFIGIPYYYSTENKIIFWDGSNWLNADGTSI